MHEDDKNEEGVSSKEIGTAELNSKESKEKPAEPEQPEVTEQAEIIETHTLSPANSNDLQLEVVNKAPLEKKESSDEQKQSQKTPQELVAERKCPNCETQLAEQDKYCPTCGQRFGKVRLTFGEFIYEVFNNFLGYDSQLWKSIVPFLFIPGKLTEAFNSGKRVRYVHPLRLYIVLSVFYFFALKVLWSQTVVKPYQKDPSGPAVVEMDEAKDKEQKEKTQQVIDSVMQRLENEHPEVLLGDSADLKAKLQEAIDEAGKKAELQKVDWTDPTTYDGASSEVGLGTFIKLFQEAEDMSNDAILDSLKVGPEGRTEFAHHMINQGRRLAANDKNFFVSYVFSNLPLMMIFLLPLFAFLLKVLYIRSGKLYMFHMVHGLHLHALAFFAYGTLFYVIAFGADSSWLVGAVLTLVTVYAYFSFKKVYKQSYRKTLFKFVLVGMAYSVLILLGLLGELMVTFMIY